MKKIFFFITALVFVSCSNDDNNTTNDNGGNIPAEEKLLERFFFDSGLSIDLDYNGNKTVKRLNLMNYYYFDFKYSGETITSVTAIAEGESVIFDFSHDINGKIDGVLVNGEERIVEYDDETNSYLYYEEGDDDRTTIFMNEFGDIERLKMSDANNEDTNFVFLYIEDEDKTGPMANTNNIQPYMAMIIPDIVIYMAFMGQKPAELISFSDGTFQCSNTYYNDGFIDRANIIISSPNQENPSSAGIYKYTKLQP